MLDLLWRQWTALGVAGQVPPQAGIVLDPESLVLASCTLARSDPHLFDAMLDWMRINGRYLNIARLQRMLREYPYSGGAVFAAAADSISTSERRVKWTRSAASRRAGPPQTLFFLGGGQELPVVREPDPIFQNHGLLRDPYEPRGAARRFDPNLQANLLLRLRAFLGVNARCEILAYLMVNRLGSPRAMAKACGFYPATVARALAEMGDSGLLVSRIEGRHRFYSLASGEWNALFLGLNRPAWIHWAPLFCALEHAWHFLEACGREPRLPLAQASDLRRLLKASLLALLAGGGPAIPVGDYAGRSGETLLPFFQEQMRSLFSSIENLSTTAP